ncbi:ABC transporter substrate-binding protein [Fusobacterium sp. SYSU M8D902]|uniref:ABC transporter substrate-binding protein n=1 Tax=Fusobacterium sp. SYSU M8D902 TaxID=3159562 RepID=UPI0032E506C7
MKNLLKIMTLFLVIATLNFANDKKYNRIATINLSSDEMILNLVSSSRIVGLSGMITEDEDMSNVCNIAKSYTKIEGNIETLLNLEPDLVIGADWIKKEQLQQIEDSGIDTYIYKTPKTFEEQKEVILKLADLVEEKEKGIAITKNMDIRLKKLQKKIKLENKGILKIMLYTSLETTSGKETTFDEFLRLIGGINPVSEAGIIGEVKISKETLIDIDPDIIIVPIWKGHINSEEFMNFLVNDESFKNIRAVKNKKIYGIPFKKLSPTSQYMIDGIEYLGEKIYGLEREQDDNRKEI